MDHSEYFQNLDLIEKTWRFLLKEKFPEKGKLELMNLTKKGRILFKSMIETERHKGFSIPKTVPAFEREVMLLEKENKNEEAIKLCEEAIHLGINSLWYNNKVKKFQRQISK